jgi:hypothetical protein
MLPKAIGLVTPPPDAIPDPVAGAEQKSRGGKATCHEFMNSYFPKPLHARIASRRFALRAAARRVPRHSSPDTLRLSRIILSFRHKGLEQCFTTGRTRGINAQHAAKLRRLLTALCIQRKVWRA